MVKDVFRICPLDLMMKSMHFQVKKRLSHEVQKVTVELSSVIRLSAHPPLSAASVHLAQRRIWWRIWQSINIKAAR